MTSPTVNAPLKPQNNNLEIHITPQDYEQTVIDGSRLGLLVDQKVTMLRFFTFSSLSHHNQTGLIPHTCKVEEKRWRRPPF